MDRRDFMRLGLAGATLTGMPRAAAAAPGAAVLEASATDLAAALAAGRATSQALVRAYLSRIRAIDQAGPRLKSVIEVNPDALKIAAALDRERKAGRVRGPLHGLPVLIKDNIATADAMQTTAGSLALVGVKPPRDAFIVTRLREAGAVILGKTNLSEWANLRSTRSTSGWSARGGQTRNPHALDRNPSGSSSGSGAAMAASLAALAVGTETDGSIISPANACGIVGMKPTLGLVSRDGIIPLSHSQDTAGPMTRTVADAALLLAALAGPDARDDATREAKPLPPLTPRDLAGVRLGVVRANFTGRNDHAIAVCEQALKVLAGLGATLVDVEVPNTQKFGQSELEVLLYELKADMARYLAEFAPGSGYMGLDDLIAFNERHRAREMPWFGQEYFTRAAAKGGLDAKEYLDALANNHRYARVEGLDVAFATHRVEALVAPSGAPASLTDVIRGDPGGGGGFTSPAAVAGYPHITVPAGTVHGLPVGLSFVAPAWQDANLLAIAMAYEAASRARVRPRYLKTVNPVA